MKSRPESVVCQMQVQTAADSDKLPRPVSEQTTVYGFGLGATPRPRAIERQMKLVSYYKGLLNL
jgi:hypothetical protein